MRKISEVSQEYIMPFEDFYEEVSDGCICDYDGVGYFCDDEYVYDNPVLYCDKKYLDYFRGRFNKVVWYNR